jgi:hypothetical protein
MVIKPKETCVLSMTIQPPTLHTGLHHFEHPSIPFLGRKILAGGFESVTPVAPKNFSIGLLEAPSNFGHAWVASMRPFLLDYFLPEKLFLAV